MFNRLALAAALVCLIPAYAHADKPAHPEESAPAHAYAELTQGNTRFMRGKPRHPHESTAERAKLAGGQKPHTIVVSCSDSRVPPELVFDAGLGQIFTVRIAGNVLTSESIASIEYAIEHLGARMIVVMGHESCGAVKAALAAEPGKSAGSPHLDRLLADVNRCMASTKLTDEDRRDPHVLAASRANVTGVVAELLTSSTIIAERVQKKEVALVPALYRLETGAVEFGQGQGAPLGREVSSAPRK